MIKTYQFGLKLWSTNLQYIPEALRLYAEGVYQYIELYAVPDSFDNTIKFWRDLAIPFNIHAPHYKNGLNFSQVQFLPANFKLAKEAMNFADALKAQTVIFHPGMNGEIKETIRQIKLIYDSRMVIENKPYVGLEDGLICVGSRPDEIKFIMQETGLGFCLDIGHAICAANSNNQEPLAYLKQFLALDPVLYHLTDGNYVGVLDQHLHYGQGSFPLAEIVKLIPSNVRITNESIKNDQEKLVDFKEDMGILINLIKKL